jgi:hypothetical protein
MKNEWQVCIRPDHVELHHEGRPVNSGYGATNLERLGDLLLNATTANRPPEAIETISFLIEKTR